MGDAISIAARPAGADRGLRSRLRAAFLRSEALRGYTLLSPTLIVMAFAMCAPFAILVAMSFWTQHAFDIDTTFTLRDYQEATSELFYRALLIRSLWISGT